MDVSNLFDSKNFNSDCNKVPLGQIKSLLKKLKLKTSGTKDNLCNNLEQLYNINQNEFIDYLYISQYKQGACEKYSTKDLLQISKERNMSEKMLKGLKKRDLCKAILLPYHPNWIPGSTVSKKLSGTCNEWSLKDLQNATGDYDSTKSQLCLKYLDNKTVLRSIEAQKTLVSTFAQDELLKIKNSNFEDLNSFDVNTNVSNFENIKVLNALPNYKILYNGINGTIITFDNPDLQHVVGKIAPNESLEPSSIIHEVCIGSFINTLSRGNWMQVLNCYYVPSVYNDNLTVMGVYKNVNGTHLNKVIIENNLSTKEIILIILQIALALHEAQKKFMFMHYDLHEDNILIVNEKTEFTIGNSKLVSNWRPVIIDYGEAILRFDNHVYLRRHTEIPIEYLHNLKYSSEKFFIPLWDIWRLLTSLIGFMAIPELNEVVNHDTVNQFTNLIVEFFKECFYQTNTEPVSELIKELFNAESTTQASILSKYLEYKGKVSIEDLLPFKLSLKNFIDFLFSKITN